MPSAVERRRGEHRSPRGVNIRATRWCTRPAGGRNLTRAAGGLGADLAIVATRSLLGTLAGHTPQDERLCAMQLGDIGVWRRRQDGADGLAELEALGFGALWVGGSPSLEDARPFLERSSTLTIATGILNVWQHDPADVAQQHAELTREYPGRFLLGIGIGHPEATAEYTSPLARMRAFFDGLDAAAQPVPRDERAAAALGPKMLELAAQRSLGPTPTSSPPSTRASRASRRGRRADRAGARGRGRDRSRTSRARRPASTRRSTWACATTPRISCASASPNATSATAAATG